MVAPGPRPGDGSCRRPAAARHATARHVPPQASARTAPGRGTAHPSPSRRRRRRAPPRGPRRPSLRTAPAVGRRAWPGRRRHSPSTGRGMRSSCSNGRPSHVSPAQGSASRPTGGARSGSGSGNPDGPAPFRSTVAPPCVIGTVGPGSRPTRSRCPRASAHRSWLHGLLATSLHAGAGGAVPVRRRTRVTVVRGAADASRQMSTTGTSRVASASITAVAIADMPSALGCTGAAGAVGISPSIHLIPGSVHTSWPMNGV